MAEQKKESETASTSLGTVPSYLVSSRTPMSRVYLQHIVIAFCVLVVVILAVIFFTQIGPTGQLQENNCSTIEIPAGKLRGRVLDPFYGRHAKVVAFLGIPFAENPSGERRFRKPNCPSAWERVYDATYKRPPCMQSTYYIGKTRKVDNSNTTEDCLHLNVWVPGTCIQKGRKYTVFVFIYGGAFLNGGNSYDFYDGRFLASYGNVIVIVPNYRLGVFGFLNAGTRDAPGNAALHDMIIALRWVSRYSEYFGGNPDDITVAGHSAGAISLALLASSPKLDQSLIKKMILMSASSYTPLIRNTDDAAQSNFMLVSTASGCATGDVEQKLTCLRSKTGWEILRAQEESGIWTSPSFYDEVLPEYPTDAMRRFLRASEKRLLLSVTRSEGDSFFYSLFRNIVEQNGTIDATAIKSVFKSINMPDFVINMLIFLFSKKYDVYARDYKGWRDLLGDALFYCPVQHYGNVFHSVGGSKSYFFMYEPKPSFSETPGQYATHGEDVVMLFGLPYIYPRLATDEDRAISLRLMRLFTDFAKNKRMPRLRIGDWPTFTSRDAQIGKMTYSGIYPVPRKGCLPFTLYYVTQRRGGGSLNCTVEALAGGP